MITTTEMTMLSPKTIEMSGLGATKAVKTTLIQVIVIQTRMKEAHHPIKPSQVALLPIKEIDLKRVKDVMHDYYKIM